MRLKQSRALFTSSDRAVCREIVEDPMSKRQVLEAITALGECAEAAGWRVDRTNARWTFYSPDKAQKPLPISTTADKQGIYALVSALRKAGLDVTRDPNEPPEGIRETAATVDAITVDINGNSDTALRDYISASVDALYGWYEQSATRIREELETSFMGELEALRKEIETERDRADAAEAQASRLVEERDRLGRERDELKVKEAEATERALKAENKLRMFRAALQED